MVSTDIIALLLIVIVIARAFDLEVALVILNATAELVVVSLM